MRTLLILLVLTFTSHVVWVECTDDPDDVTDDTNDVTDYTDDVTDDVTDYTDDVTNDTDEPIGAWMDPPDLKGMDMTEFHDTFGLGYSQFYEVRTLARAVKAALNKKYGSDEPPEVIIKKEAGDDLGKEDLIFHGDSLLTKDQIFQLVNGTDPEMARSVMPDFKLPDIIQKYKDQAIGQTLERRKVIEFSTSIFTQITNWNPYYKWPTVIVWTGDKSFSPEWRRLILQAMDEIQRNTCIKFIPVKGGFSQKKRFLHKVIGGFVDDALDALEDAVKDLGKGLADTVKKAADVFGDVVFTVLDFTKNLSEGLRGLAVDLLTFFTPDFIDVIIHDLADIMSNVDAHLLDMFKDTLDDALQLIDPHNWDPATMAELIASMAKDLVLNAASLPWKLFGPPPLPRIHFEDSGGSACNSQIGRNFWQSIQPINLGSICFPVRMMMDGTNLPIPHGSIVHELCHALGLVHEHQRADRNDSVEILDNDKTNFLEIKNQQEHILRAIPYDFSSVMHYPAGGVRARPSTGMNVRTSYQRFGLAFSDTKAINMAYCSDRCSTQLACEHGGYTDPKDCSRCRCQKFWRGQLCQLFNSGVSDSRCPMQSKRWLDAQTVCVDVDYREFGSASHECNWLFEAVNGRSLFYWFEDIDILQTSLGLCYDHVELRRGDDLDKRGPRFCGPFITLPAVFKAPQITSRLLVHISSNIVDIPNVNQNVKVKLCVRDAQCIVENNILLQPQTNAVPQAVGLQRAAKTIVGWSGDNNDQCRTSVTFVTDGIGLQWMALNVGKGTRKKPDKYYRSFAFNHHGRGGVWERGVGMKKPVEVNFGNPTTGSFIWSHPTDDVAVVILLYTDFRYRGYVRCGSDVIMTFNFQETPEGVTASIAQHPQSGRQWHGLCFP